MSNLHTVSVITSLSIKSCLFFFSTFFAVVNFFLESSTKTDPSQSPFNPYFITKVVCHRLDHSGFDIQVANKNKYKGFSPYANFMSVNFITAVFQKFA